MAKLVTFEFPFEGPWGNEMAEMLAPLAHDIANEQGLIWKVWTEAPDRKVAGGVYLFKDDQSAAAYIQKHTERLAGFGITQMDARRYDTNETLSKITKGQ